MNERRAPWLTVLLPLLVETGPHWRLDMNLDETRVHLDDFFYPSQVTLTLDVGTH